MKKLVLSIMLIVTLVAVLLTGPAMALTHLTTNGATCVAANQSQAFGLAWNHARISNTSKVDRWILCPVTRTLDFVDTTDILSYFYDSSIAIDIWFGDTAANDAEVTCIVRDMDNEATTNVPVTSKTVNTTTVKKLPATETAEFSFGTFTSLSSQVTVACRLAPNTGINTLRMLANIQTP